MAIGLIEAGRIVRYLKRVPAPSAGLHLRLCEAGVSNLIQCDGFASIGYACSEVGAHLYAWELSKLHEGFHVPVTHLKNEHDYPVSIAGYCCPMLAILPAGT